MLDLIWTPPAQQKLFRRLLDAASRPGLVVDLSPHLGGAPASLGVLAAFVDGSVTLADPDDLLADADWRFLEARRGAPNDAHFVLARGDLAPREEFSPLIGELGNPERSASIVLGVGRLDDAAADVLTLAGPGIPGTRHLAVAGLDPAWLARRARWVRHFPLGVDLTLVDSAGRAAVLPRTTRITGQEA